MRLTASTGLVRPHRTDRLNVPDHFDKGAAPTNVGSGWERYPKRL